MKNPRSKSVPVVKRMSREDAHLLKCARAAARKAGRWGWYYIADARELMK